MDEDGDALTRAAQRLELTSDLALTLFEHSPDAVLIVGEDGVIELVNRQAELLTGHHRSELCGSRVELLLPEALRETHIQHRSTFMGDPRIRPMGVGLDLRVRRKNGDEVPVDINLSPAALRSGMYVIVTVRRRR